jgi:hypothetical protein
MKKWCHCDYIEKILWKEIIYCEYLDIESVGTFKIGSACYSTGKQNM